MATSSETALSIDVDTFATYSDALQAAALTTTRLAATCFPPDLSFYRSIDPTLTRDVDAFSDRVLSLARKLVHISSGKTTRIQEEEDVVDEFVRNVVDPMEEMLERTDGALDAFLGKRKDPGVYVPAVPVDPNQNKSKKQAFLGRLDPSLTHASHLPKPQLSFEYTLSNTDESPYIPASLIPHKWCAMVPLGYVLRDERPVDAHEDEEEDEDDERRKRMLHPYYYELTHPSYPDHVFNLPVELSLPSPLDPPPSGAITSGSPTFISTPRALLFMANAISSVTELAVDLEHHSYRSYRGFLALMQISTRQEDFLVDLLVPEVREGLRQTKGKGTGRSEEARVASDAGKIIARIFADPSVIKVFHGAESDVVWLQQDFNIFVVGLFDTFHASRLLEFPKHSLAYLLETYCGFIPDKRYQLADWRIRPLPAEMSTYARSDTHFLLYIYDVLRRLLIERSSTIPAVRDETQSLEITKQVPRRYALVYDVLSRSSRTALRLHEIDIYDAESGTGSNGWKTLARKWNKIELVSLPSRVRGIEIQGSQAAVYRALHRWREDMARQEDESTRYVLPTHHLFLLAERTPATIPDLLLVFGGPGGANGGVPPVLKRRAGELVMVIKGALETSKPMSSPRRSVVGRGEDIETVDSAVIKESGAIGSTIPSSAAKPTNESRLWTVASSSTSATDILVSRSSLFGVKIPEEHVRDKRVPSLSSVGGTGTHCIAGSVLLGTMLTKTSAASSSSMIKSTFTCAKISDEPTGRFKDLMEKIHKTLAIAPVMSVPSCASSVRTWALATSPPGLPVNVGVASETSTIPDLMPSGLEGQIEIPFVPAHQRQTLANPQNYEIRNDTIVTVGQAGARQRKRKRAKAGIMLPASQSGSEIQMGGAETSASTCDRDRQVEEFDYSSVPNLLDGRSKHGDAQGVHDEDERRTKKLKRGKGMLPLSLD